MGVSPPRRGVLLRRPDGAQPRTPVLRSALVETRRWRRGPLRRACPAGGIAYRRMSTVVDVTPDWLPAGEEPRALGKITHCTILRQGAISVVSLASGDIDSAAEPSPGLYSRDTRHLSRLKLTLGGVTPILLDSSSSEGQSAIFTNPAFSSPDGSEFIPAQALVLRRERALASTLVESISISNYSSRRALVEVRIEFDADFRDIFEVRGFERSHPQPPVSVEHSASVVNWCYDGSDGK